MSNSSLSTVKKIIVKLNAVYYDIYNDYKPKIVHDIIFDSKGDEYFYLTLSPELWRVKKEGNKILFNMLNNENFKIICTPDCVIFENLHLIKSIYRFKDETLNILTFVEDIYYSYYKQEKYNNEMTIKSDEEYISIYVTDKNKKQYKISGIKFKNKKLSLKFDENDKDTIISQEFNYLDELDKEKIELVDEFIQTGKGNIKQNFNMEKEKLKKQKEKEKEKLKKQKEKEKLKKQKEKEKEKLKKQKEKEKEKLKKQKEKNS